MKKLFVSTIVLLTSTSFAATPNLYECAGKGITLLFSQATDELSALIIKQDEMEITRSGAEITITPSPIGRLITVTKESIPDLETSSVSFVIPDINLLGNRASVPFLTSFLEHTSRTSIAGPSLVDGLINQVNRVVMLNCKALMDPLLGANL